MDRLAKIETIDGFKEEYSIEWSIPFYARYGEKLAVFAGGTKSRFLEFRPFRGIHRRSGGVNPEDLP